MDKNDKWFIRKKQFQKLIKSSSIYFYYLLKRDILPEKERNIYNIKFPTFGSIILLKVLMFFFLIIIDEKKFGVSEIKIYYIFM